ncbi:SPOR domain-containing protein [Methylophaga sp.]|uniref:SPOR domain-containing protein n=1 Tax=Methylophaga sp. TaxID=2024840 RepID=UPI0025E5405D|nr:SPOR domain-containing protein [Methylophaga sp.]
MTLIQQQRLLGAVLLVCLIGVIAWFLLDTVEQNQPAQPQEEPIAFDSVIEPIPEDVEVVEPVEEAMLDPQGLSQADAEDEPQTSTETEKASTVSAESSPEPEPAPKPEPKAAPDPEPAPVPQTEPDTEQQKPESQPAATSTAEPKWVLQLASFSVRENADALSAQLKQMGYDPMIETISSAGTLIYRVRLQPVTDRIKLQQTAQTLSQKLKLNAQILQHNP